MIFRSRAEKRCPLQEFFPEKFQFCRGNVPGFPKNPAGAVLNQALIRKFPSWYPKITAPDACPSPGHLRMTGRFPEPVREAGELERKKEGKEDYDGNVIIEDKT